MALRETDLGDEGREYVVSSLRGETGLCSKILVESQRAGEVFAPLPVGTSRERAVQFNAGGLMSRHETFAWFARHLQQLSGDMPTGSLVFEDVWAKPQDAARSRDGLFFDQSNVYYVIDLDLDKSDAAAIEFAVRQIKSFLFVAVFSSFNFRAADVPPTRVVTAALIDQIAKGAQEVFLSAYDQEGLVVWRRKA